MKQLCFKYLITFLLFSQGLFAQVLVFGISPYREPSELNTIYKELIDYLSQALHQPIRIVISNDYAHLIELIASEKVDFASVSPRLLSELRQKVSNTTYLATIQTKDKNNVPKSTYRSVIVVREDSTIETLQGLRSKRFAFTDKDSTSGYIYPNMLLKGAGIDAEHDFSALFMLKKHPKAVQAVLEGSVDGAGVSQEALEGFSPTEKKRLRILAQSEEIPYDALVASHKMEQVLQKKIKALLLEFRSATSLPSGIVGFEEKPIALYDRLFRLE